MNLLSEFLSWHTGLSNFWGSIPRLRIAKTAKAASRF
jgi:hypothetical protein